jgi:ATP synthase protein I
MTINGSGRPSVPSVSGATPGPWLAILRTCLLATAAVVAVLAIVAGLAAGTAAAAASAALGGLLVAVFFGISLLIGHVVGRRNPSAALGAFLAGYVVKVLGFGVLAFGFGRPEWLDTRWFFVAAVVSVVVWQAAELRAFSKLRLRLYGDPADAKGPGGKPGPHAGGTRGH